MPKSCQPVIPQTEAAITGWHDYWWSKYLLDAVREDTLSTINARSVREIEYAIITKLGARMASFLIHKTTSQAACV